MIAIVVTLITVGFLIGLVYLSDRHQKKNLH